MDHLIFVLYLCVALPMIPLIIILPEKKSKLLIGYVLVGMTICLNAGSVNSALINFFGGDLLYVTSTISPVSEEILKALPVLYFALIFSDDKDTLLSISFADGIGFAMLENAYILTQNVGLVSPQWAITRVIGATLVHGAATAAVGLGMSYVKKRRKLFFCGTFALLISAIIFHGIFNVFVQSKYNYVAFLFPSVVYAGVVCAVRLKKQSAPAKAKSK
ncbi:MAG: PrsW family intramembrane metalloprotease [Lachnospiraceae bacterium]|nr:PrsW family intramembrane metalloprotease [Lachnospiraceae bacterium]